jgi:hypothetical protein
VPAFASFLFFNKSRQQTPLIKVDRLLNPEGSPLITEHPEPLKEGEKDPTKVREEIDARLSSLYLKLSNLGRDIESTALGKIDHVVDNLDESISALTMCLTQATESLAGQLEESISAVRRALNIPRHVDEKPVSAFFTSILVGLIISGLRSEQRPYAANPPSIDHKSAGSIALSAIILALKPVASTITLEILRRMTSSKKYPSTPPAAAPTGHAPTI